jgi:hypothetical protein
MKFIVLLFSLVSFYNFACSSEKKANEKIPFTSQITVLGESGVSVYYPSEVENAKASYAVISFGGTEERLFTVPTDVKEPPDLENKPELINYSVSYFYIKSDMMDKAFITVHYRFPKTEDGGIIMCGPIRMHKISELAVKKV